MPELPYHLMSRFERTYFEPEGSPEPRSDARSMTVRTARERLERLIGTVEWFEGEQRRAGFGPVGRCLAAWVDAYPLVAFLDPTPAGHHSGLVSGHGSWSGSSASGLMLNMLAFAARNPNGRLDSDSQWLRRGGRAGFFAFYGANPELSEGRTLADILENPDLGPAPEQETMPDGPGR